MTTTTRERPVIIGIVGDSAAGKTTFAAGLVQILGSERTMCIGTDDYHRYSRRERARLGITPHHPDANYIDILEQHVDLLRDAQPILKPVYDHDGGVLRPPEYAKPAPFIILEGLLGFSAQRLRDAYDVKIYLDPRTALRLRWKFQRDTGFGGYAVEDVMSAIETLKRDSDAFVIPQRAYADMVICFCPPDENADENGPRLNVRHILRPTLPALDLAPILEAGAGRGMAMELARDIDGIPVDALDLSGPVVAGDPELETLLWSRLARPEATMPHLGRYFDEAANVAHSRPLALSQLLVAHYLMDAAAQDAV
ncbi:MAG TPA: phosphoribulokinase [Rhodospirillales bacterium]|nr:phosphoribulokinase [Rhodospirillales bacterium]